MLVVLEFDFGGVQLAALFDVDLAGPVDQDIGDLIVPQQRLQRSESEQLVLDLLDEASLVGVGEQPALLVENVGDGLGHFLRGQRRLQAFQPRDVQRLEQAVVHRELELLKALGLHVADGALAIAAAHQRALKRRRRCIGLLRNSFDQLHRVTSAARADNVQQARDQRI